MAASSARSNAPRNYQAVVDAPHIALSAGTVRLRELGNLAVRLVHTQREIRIVAGLPRVGRQSTIVLSIHRSTLRSSSGAWNPLRTTDLYQPDRDVGSFSIGDTSFSPTQQLQSPLQSVRKNALNGKPVGCEEDVSSPSTLSQLALLYDPELPQNGFQSAFDVDSLQLANQASVAHTEVPDKFCTCSTTILETLHTLHKQSNNPQNPFDVVLSINKQALGSLSAVLVCSCARDPTSVITLAAAVTKMISWYQYTIFPVPKTMASHMPNLPSSPITIGAYRLNRADEDYVKTQVVLHELKKVELLIDKFYEMHSDQPEYRANGDLLRRRLKDAVEALQRVSRSSGVA
ncbi:MAG: hypothetical protein Q9190_000529 [Brigantiaea leucoxantha]